MYLKSPWNTITTGHRFVYPKPRPRQGASLKTPWAPPEPTSAPFTYLPRKPLRNTPWKKSPTPKPGVSLQPIQILANRSASMTARGQLRSISDRMTRGNEARVDATPVNSSIGEPTNSPMVPKPDEPMNPPMDPNLFTICKQKLISPLFQGCPTKTTKTTWIGYQCTNQSILNSTNFSNPALIQHLHQKSRTNKKKKAPPGLGSTSQWLPQLLHLSHPTWFFHSVINFFDNDWNRE